jgi:hypothetical protein
LQLSQDLYVIVDYDQIYFEERFRALSLKINVSKLNKNQTGGLKKYFKNDALCSSTELGIVAVSRLFFSKQKPSYIGPALSYQFSIAAQHRYRTE